MLARLRRHMQDQLGLKLCRVPGGSRHIAFRSRGRMLLLASFVSYRKAFACAPAMLYARPRRDRRLAVRSISLSNEAFKRINL